MICNGERPLSGYVNQGGAINRILEIECGEKVYSDPQKTANTVKMNYGHAGKDFVRVIKELGVEQIKHIQQEFQTALFDTDKMQKQSLSLSIVLTADKIATDYIFKDEAYISLDDAKKVLSDRNEISDNERCYQYLLDKIAMNATRFDGNTNCEKWGTTDKGYAILYNQAFNELCESGHFSKRSFLSWATKNGVVQADSKGNPTRPKKIDGKNSRCVFLKLAPDESEESNDWVSFQGKLPFE